MAPWCLEEARPSGGLGMCFILGLPPLPESQGGVEEGLVTKKGRGSAGVLADPLQVEVSANILDGRALLVFLQDPASLAGVAVPKPADAEGLLRSLLTWQDRGNLYREGSASVNWCIESLVPKATFPLDGKAPADWKRLLNDPQAEVTEGRLRYSGGDILARADKAPEQLTPLDFRLRPNSAGYRAGKDGKDLGADVDLVGPGPAYERWKKTPEYQQWLEETGQLTKVAGQKSEPNAFVLLGAKGAFERKFATLAEAVRGASDGDTIEIRGNGPKFRRRRIEQLSKRTSRS